MYDDMPEAWLLAYMLALHNGHHSLAAAEAADRAGKYADETLRAFNDRWDNWQQWELKDNVD